MIRASEEELARIARDFVFKMEMSENFPLELSRPQGWKLVNLPLSRLGLDTRDPFVARLAMIVINLATGFEISEEILNDYLQIRDLQRLIEDELDKNVALRKTYAEFYHCLKLSDFPKHAAVYFEDTGRVEPNGIVTFLKDPKPQARHCTEERIPVPYATIELWDSIGNSMTMQVMENAYENGIFLRPKTPPNIDL